MRKWVSSSSSTEIDSRASAMATSPRFWSTRGGASRRSFPATSARNEQRSGRRLRGRHHPHGRAHLWAAQCQRPRRADSGPDSGMRQTMHRADRKNGHERHPARLQDRACGVGAYRPVNTGPVIGVDLGVKTLATHSDSTVEPNPRSLKHRLKTLKRLRRAVSRKRTRKSASVISLLLSGHWRQMGSRRQPHRERGDRAPRDRQGSRRGWGEAVAVSR